MRLLRSALLLALAPLIVTAQPTVLRSEIVPLRIGPTPGTPVRIAYDAANDLLFVLTLTGDLHAVGRTPGDDPERLYTIDDHGLRQPRGLAIAPDGTIYLSGNDPDREAALNTGRIVRGKIVADARGSRTWTTVASTEPYPLSLTAFDHTVTGIAVDPSGARLYVSSGSRTDHGEVQSAEGRFPGLRETGITAIILSLPTDTTDLLLRDDRDWLNTHGLVHAEGVRNHFDLAFGPGGDLFGAENSGDRDDSEELNRLRAGRHYGFPWRIGLNDTPQQFTPYDPLTDPLVNPGALALQQGYFYDDPDYPPPPDLPFVDPIPNYGPDADVYRDPTDGTLRDASEEGDFVGSFTAHRSPLGLVFDTDSALAEPYRGDGFVMGWTGSDNVMFAGMDDTGEDLLHLELTRTDNGYTMNATRIVAGFDHPVDAVLVGTTLYVVQFGGEDLWALAFPSTPAVAREADVPPSAFVLDAPHPHPARTYTVLSFTLSSPQPVRIDLFDVLGRRLRSLEPSRLPAGPHRLRLDTSDLTPGMYVYRLSAGPHQAAHTLSVAR